MTKNRSTKRALLMSALALVMCFAMLIGSTFAWFTDSVTSAGNKIMAGNLDVELHMFNGTDYVDISNSVNPIFGGENSLSAQNVNADTLWEPGKTQVAYLKIVNNGSLALKYTVGLDVTNVSKNLYKVMKYDIVENATNAAPVTAWNGGNSVVEGVQSVSGDVSLAAGGEHYFALAIHMDESAGNEYQNGQVNFDLTILATQDTVEADSFNNQYDVFADYDGEISNAVSLKAALENGGTYKVVGDITLDTTVEIPVGVEVALDLNGKTLSNTAIKQKHVLVNNGTLTIVGGTISSLGADGGSAINNKGTLTAKNVTLNGAPYVGADGWWPSYAVNNTGTMTLTDSIVTAEHGGVASSNGVVTLNNLTVTVGKNGVTNAALYTGGGKIIVNGGTYTNRATDQNATGASVINGAITVNAGTFNGRIENYYGTPVIKGGTFSVNPNASFVAPGYQVTNNGDGTWTVGAQKVSTGTELAAALANGKAVELTQDVTYNTPINNDANIALNGNTFETTGTINLGNNADLTMTNGDYEVNSTYGHIDVRPSTAEGSVVTFEDVEFTNNYKTKTYGPSTNRLGSVVEVCATTAGAKTVVVFKNCTFNNAQILFEGMSGKIGEFEATFENCTFNALTSSAPIYVQNYVKGTLNVKNCTFNLECTSSVASAISISSSSTTSVTVNAENNTINAKAATAYTFDPALGETEVNNVKVNGTPANIKFISAFENAIVTEIGTIKEGIAK